MSSSPTLRRAQTLGNLSAFLLLGQLTARRCLVVSRTTSSGCGPSSRKQTYCITSLHEGVRVVVRRCVIHDSTSLFCSLKITGMILHAPLPSNVPDSPVGQTLVAVSPTILGNLNHSGKAINHLPSLHPVWHVGIQCCGWTLLDVSWIYATSQDNNPNQVSATWQWAGRMFRSSLHNNFEVLRLRARITASTTKYRLTPWLQWTLRTSEWSRSTILPRCKDCSLWNL